MAWPPPATRRRRFDDFRRMLDRADIDAVVVSTPDHWHALMTMLACAAGKDVYVEKPLTLFLREGEWMIDAARRHDGSCRSAPSSAPARTISARGAAARRAHRRDSRRARQHGAQHHAGLHRAGRQAAAPAHWDMWLGPAPGGAVQPDARPLPLPLVLGLLRRADDQPAGARRGHRPVGHRPGAAAVAAFAQRRSLTGIGETPDVFEGIFEYPGFLLNWSSREVAAGGRGGLEMYGTRGTLAINRRGFEILPDPQLTPESQIPRFTGPAGRTDDTGAAVRARQGRRLRPGARPVPAARQEFPRLA